MKAIKYQDGRMMCRSEDAVYYSDDTCQLIAFENESIFKIGERCNIDSLFEKEKDGWTALLPSLECNDSNYKAITGETSWGGGAFVGLKKEDDDSFEWIVHISNLNNPVKIWIADKDVHVLTDLNHPNGREFVIPMNAPSGITSNDNSR